MIGFSRKLGKMNVSQSGEKPMDVVSLDGLEQLLEGGDMLSPGEMSPGVDHLVTAAIAPADPELIEEFRKQISELKVENQALQKELQGATWRNGYLESQAETKDLQIRLLTDSQHKPSWWTRLASWFSKAQ